MHQLGNYRQVCNSFVSLICITQTAGRCKFPQSANLLLKFDFVNDNNMVITESNKEASKRCLFNIITTMQFDIDNIISEISSFY